MRLVTAHEMRALDRSATERYGVPGAVLMRRAGLGVADLVRRLAHAAGCRDLPVVLVAGGGNNGGDVFAAAAELLRWGFRVHVRLTVEPARIKGEARIFLEALRPGCVEVLSESTSWEIDSPAFFPRGTVFVDGILGTGSNAPPHGCAAAAIRWLQRAASVGRIVAVDLPSGLDPDSGVCHTPHVVADVTACLALPKQGLRSEQAKLACGRVEIVDIGFPGALTGETETDGWGWIGEPELRPLLPERPRDAHKGIFGHLLVVGGSQGFSGAAAMTAMGSVRSGAGLTTVITPRSVAGVVAEQVPEAMIQPIGSDYTESLHLDAMGDDWTRRCDGFDAVVAGPGLSQRDGVADVVESLLSCHTRNLVLDADALNGLAGRGERLRSASARLVLTPHPGEAGRLLGVSADEVQQDRPAALRRLVKLTRSVVVLKGAGTLVGAPGRGVHQILAGNSGMATGGSGDLLAGILGGLLAQGMQPFDAARLAVWWHAAAGDLAAWRQTQHTLATRDMAEGLGQALSWLSAR